MDFDSGQDLYCWDFLHTSIWTLAVVVLSAKLILQLRFELSEENETTRHNWKDTLSSFLLLLFGALIGLTGALFFRNDPACPSFLTAILEQPDAPQIIGINPIEYMTPEARLAMEKYGCEPPLDFEAVRAF
jgi:hypothetical protein